MGGTAPLGRGPDGQSVTQTTFSGTGQVTALAVDPSDPSGNTVYIGAATGGVWKTTNFLTTSPIGPTYVPLTDFGPTNAINIGAIAVFPRNNDPRQSIIFAGTGEGDGLGTTHSPLGVGFLRSMDGGATWQLIDSLNNNFEADDVTPVPINGASPISGKTRDHTFLAKTTSYTVTYDPTPTLSGDYIIYAALSGTNGGLYPASTRAGPGSCSQRRAGDRCRPRPVQHPEGRFR